MKEIEIEVDGLLVPVDAEKYEGDPEAVIAGVRRNREQVRVGADPARADRILGRKS